MIIRKKKNIIVSIIIVLSFVLSLVGCSSSKEIDAVNFNDVPDNETNDIASFDDEPINEIDNSVDLKDTVDNATDDTSNLIDMLDSEIGGAINLVDAADIETDDTIDGNLDSTPDEESVNTVLIKLNCRKNTFFDTYDIHLYIDYTYEAKLAHGTTNIYSVELERGWHTLTLKNEDVLSYYDGAAGSVDFFVSGDTSLSYIVRCDHYEIEVDNVAEELGKINKANIIKFEKTAPSGKEIRRGGYIYIINNTYNFEKSDFTLHNLKVCYAGQAHYYITFDYTIKNRSDDVLEWSLHNFGNVYGDVLTDTVQDEWLCGNDHVFDWEFGNGKKAGTLNPNEEFYDCALLLFTNCDEHYKEVMLHENEHMIYNLYYNENGTKHCCTVELNE